MWLCGVTESGILVVVTKGGVYSSLSLYIMHQASLGLPSTKTSCWKKSLKNVRLNLYCSSFGCRRLIVDFTMVAKLFSLLSAFCLVVKPRRRFSLQMQLFHVAGKPFGYLLGRTGVVVFLDEIRMGVCSCVAFAKTSVFTVYVGKGGPSGRLNRLPPHCPAKICCRTESLRRVVFWCIRCLLSSKLLFVISSKLLRLFSGIYFVFVTHLPCL